MASPVSLLRQHAELRLQSRRRRRFDGRFVSRGDLVFDVGANVGDRTDGYVRLGARVVAVEPQSECAAQLRRRFGDRGTVTVVQAGLGAHRGSARIAVCSTAPVLSTMSPDWQQGRFKDYEWDRSETIEVRTLDDLIAEFGVPAFAKVDVEGYELEVLRGLSRPLPALSFEWTSEGLQQAQACMARLEELSADTRFNLAVGEEAALVIDDWAGAGAVLARARAEGVSGWGDVFARWDG